MILLEVRSKDGMETEGLVWEPILKTSETRGQKSIQRFRGNFGMKQSPRNTALGPVSISDVLSCKDV